MPGQPTQGEIVWKVAELAAVRSAPSLSSAPCLLALAVVLGGVVLWNETSAQSRREERLSKLRADFAFSVAPAPRPAVAPMENPLVPEALTFHEIPRSVLGIHSPHAAKQRRETHRATPSFEARTTKAPRADSGAEGPLGAGAIAFLIIAMAALVIASLLPEWPRLAGLRRLLSCVSLGCGAAAAAGATLSRQWLAHADLILFLAGGLVAVAFIAILIPEPDEPVEGPEYSWPNRGRFAAVALAWLTGMSLASDAAAGDSDLRDAPKSVSGALAKPRQARGGGIAVSAVRAQSVAAQLGAARALSFSAAALPSAERASRWALNAFEQQQTEGGPVFGTPPGTAPETGTPPSGATGSNATQANAASTLPGVPAAEPARNGTPYQKHVDAAKDAGKKAKKKKNMGALLIAMAVALLLLALLLLRRKGKNAPKGTNTVSGRLLPTQHLPNPNALPSVPYRLMPPGTTPLAPWFPSGPVYFPYGLPAGIYNIGQSAGRAQSIGTRPSRQAAGKAAGNSAGRIQSMAPSSPARAPLAPASPAAAGAEPASGAATAGGLSAQAPLKGRVVFGAPAEPAFTNLPVNEIVGYAGEMMTDTQDAMASPSADPVSKALAAAALASAIGLIGAGMGQFQGAQDAAREARKHGEAITNLYGQSPEEWGQGRRLAELAQAAADGTAPRLQDDPNLYENRVRPYAQSVENGLRGGLETISPFAAGTEGAPQSPELARPLGDVAGPQGPGAASASPSASPTAHPWSVARGAPSGAAAPVGGQGAPSPRLTRLPTGTQGLESGVPRAEPPTAQPATTEAPGGPGASPALQGRVASGGPADTGLRSGAANADPPRIATRSDSSARLAKVAESAAKSQTPAEGGPAASIRYRTAALKTVGGLKAAPDVTAVNQANIKTLVSRIEASGVPPAAKAEAARLLTGMLGQADQSIVRNLVNQGARIIIVPEGTPLIAHPDFAKYKGKTTFDGRLWDTVRGIGYVETTNGIAMGVGAENLLGKGPYGADHTFVHEFAHMIHLGATSTALRAQIEKAYRDTHLKNETAMGPYANKNSTEAFAEATAAYFGTPHKGPVDASDLLRRNPEFHEIMREVYGAPRSLARPLKALKAKADTAAPAAGSKSLPEASSTTPREPLQGRADKQQPKPDGGKYAFNPETKKYGRIILEQGEKAGAPYIYGKAAVATAMVESTGDIQIKNPPYGDATSVGVFQELAGTLSFKERMDPEGAAERFYRKAKAQKGATDTGDAAKVAYAVQRCAAECKGRYATRLDPAEELIQELGYCNQNGKLARCPRGQVPSAETPKLLRGRLKASRGAEPGPLDPIGRAVGGFFRALDWMPSAQAGPLSKPSVVDPEAVADLLARVPGGVRGELHALSEDDLRAIAIRASHRRQSAFEIFTKLALSDGPPIFIRGEDVRKVAKDFKLHLMNSPGGFTLGKERLPFALQAIIVDKGRMVFLYDRGNFRFKNEDGKEFTFRKSEVLYTVEDMGRVKLSDVLAHTWRGTGTIVAIRIKDPQHVLVTADTWVGRKELEEDLLPIEARAPGREDPGRPVSQAPERSIPLPSAAGIALASALALLAAGVAKSAWAAAAR